MIPTRPLSVRIDGTIKVTSTKEAASGSYSPKSTSGLNHFVAACHLENNKYPWTLEQRIENELHRFAAVNARENVHQHAPLLRVGLVELALEVGDDVSARARDDPGRAQFGLDIFRVKERQHVGHDPASADRLKRLQHVPGEELVGVFERCAKRLDDGGFLRGEFRQHHRRRATAHAVGALEHVADSADGAVHRWSRNTNRSVCGLQSDRGFCSMVASRGWIKR